MNRRTGSYIAGTNFEFLAEGVYGTVFVDRAIQRIRKLYRCEDKQSQHRRDVFDSEWEALEIASGDATLRQFVIAPIFRVNGYEVLDADGNNITEDFLEDAGFEGTFIEGTFYKIGSVSAANRTTLCSAFQVRGVCNIIDASVTLNADGNIEKIIDIGMRDIELSW